ncbi:MAG: threonine--tRNA ligase [Phycisphaerae bacterium]|nr:threonine--tRNA ligase [Phycisphaerae bacterium]
MPVLTLPDGSTRSFSQPVSGLQLAADIGTGLAKAALAVTVDGQMKDLSYLIEHDALVSIVTEPKKKAGDDPAALELLRHSTAHVMAEAIQRVIPKAQLVYGPPLTDGFYYDISFPEDRPLREGDFEAIEAEMAKIVEEDRPFTRFELDQSAGMQKLTEEGSKYKVDNGERAIASGSSTLSWYATGEPGTHWEDLCRGPHLPSTGRIGAFKIMSLASSYWHGDANSDRLTRVYGTAFFRKDQLKDHLHAREEAKARDHRVLGKKLGLFHIDETVGSGLVLWTPNGATLRQCLQEFITEELDRQGYRQVFTPHIGKLDLYRTSGHFPYYRESQFPPILDNELMGSLADQSNSGDNFADRLESGDIDGFLLKPMNCPHHIQIYACEKRSYRDLPVRLAEFGTVYRWEQSGEIGGLTRVRGFTQDDGHCFCTEEQIPQELQGCLSLVRTIFDTLGMTDFRVRVGLRDPDSSKYVGEADQWDRAEQACREAAATLGVPFTEEGGEAAFYGPKIDFVVRDVIGREWQLGTVQVDYSLPERFDLSYIGPDNKPHRPVMIHRAPFGSMERFCGLLIEHFAGAFPTWLAPEQVRVLPISDKSADYAARVHADLRALRLRSHLDNSADRVQNKIRLAAEDRIPWTVVVGPRDEENDTVSVRMRGIPKDLGSIPREQFVRALHEESVSRGHQSVAPQFFPEAAEESS